MKRIMPVLLAIILITFIFPFSLGLAAPDPAPRDWEKLAPEGDLISSAVAADSAILMDANTGEVLFFKGKGGSTDYTSDANIDYPASITKIMTCLLALENTRMQDSVTIGEIGALESGAIRIGLKTGEVIVMEDLLYGFMLKSANDAGVAIAQYIAKDVESFAVMMNEKAAEIGMKNTHFVNPHGLHDDDHYTTVYDMALLAMEARKYPEFQKIVNTYEYIMPASNKNAEIFCRSTNKLISDDENEPFAYGNATGMKTGNTSKARSTLVSSAKSGNQELIAVVLRNVKRSNIWTDSITMFEYGFEFYDTINLVEMLTDKPYEVHVENAVGNGSLELELIEQGDRYLTGTIEEIDTLLADTSVIEKEVTVSIDLAAPIYIGQEIGIVEFILDGEEILTCNLVAAHDVDAVPTATPYVENEEVVTDQPNDNATPMPSQEREARNSTLTIALIAIGVLIAVALVFLIYINVQNRKRFRLYQKHRGSRRR